MSRATLKTLSEHTGLSITTVSRALKDGPEVKPDTIAIVKKAAKELGYRPNASGIGLKTGKTFVIALVMPVIKPGDVLGDVGTLPLIEGITATLEPTPYHLTVIPQEPGEAPLNPVKHVVDHGFADGIIITSTQPNDERVKLLNDANIPFVTFGRTELATQHPWYDVDNADFVYQAAMRLYGQGCQRIILFVPDRDYLFAWHRISGLKRAAMEFGREVQEEDLITEGNAENYQKFVQQAATWDQAPDGYICGTEITAMAVTSGLFQAGLTPNSDVKVVTLEVSPLAGFLHPPVTGYYQDLHRAGRTLSSLLVKRIEGEDVAKLQILDKVQLVER